MSDDLSFLDDVNISREDTGVLRNLSEMGARLKSMSMDLAVKEQAYKEAKAALENYQTVVLPAAMLSAGVSEVVLNDGSRIVVNKKVYCSPNKNDADREVIAQWLERYGGGHLLKEQCLVDGKFAGQLGNIPHSVKKDLNTNSLKAWLRSQLAIDSGTPQFQAEDIPDCIHFIQIDEVSVEA